MAHKQKGYRFENDWTLEEMRADTESGIKSGLVLPIGVEIKAEHTVLNTERVRRYITEADTIALMNCSCKMKRKHCDSPLDVCISLNGWAEKYLTSDDFKVRKPRKVTVDEAFDALKRSDEAGLVHMAYIYTDNKNNGNPDAICACCSCCCSILGGILRFGMAPHLLKATAKSERDESKCKNCGTCADRCHFGAREMVNGSLIFDNRKCFGCGLCISTCPTGANSLHQLPS
jgi:ferredoxin